MIKTVIFDVDGVLVDSEALSAQVEKEYFLSKGVVLGNEDFEKFYGVSQEASLLGLAALHGYKLDLAEALDHYVNTYCQKAAVTDISFKGAREVVLNLRKAGAGLAVCSSAQRGKVLANLKGAGLTEADFDTIVTGDDVHRAKPEPDIFRLAAIRLGAAEEECLVFEDSVNGILAAKKAGMKAAALTTTTNAEKTASAGADYIISSLAAIPSFSTMEEFISFIDGGEPECEKYGVHYVAKHLSPFPFEHTLSVMVSEAMRARENAYAPYSGFKVGAALLSARTGRIYSGCNVENSSYGATICAERNALFSAVASEGIIGVECLVVVTESDPPSPPCALCLQALAEFTKKDAPIILVDLNGNRTEYRFCDLLPLPFLLDKV